MSLFCRTPSLCVAFIIVVVLLLSDLDPTLSIAPWQAVAAQEDALDTSFFFAGLVQLTEAVLAPAWGTGGYAYAVDGRTLNATTSLRPVCVHTRTTPALLYAPFTFAMFDAQFTPLYLMTADGTTARVAGRLNLQQGCYTAAATETCMAVLLSDDAQCAAGSDDALDTSWRASDLHAPNSSMPVMRGLTGPELFTVFLSDFVQQRAWLRTAVPRSVDVLATAQQAARVFHNSSSDGVLYDSDEVADMQHAVTSEWNHYIWHVYGPQLRRKWDLLYRYAVATLRTGATAPSLSATVGPNLATDSITGVPGPVQQTRCPLVDAWGPLRHAPAQLTASRLLSLMKAAVADLTTVLDRLRVGGSGGTVAQTDRRIARLLRGVYCVTTTNLFAMTALVDRPFLHVVASVWVAAANHTDSWSRQTMESAASAKAIVADALTFQRTAAAQMAALSETLPTAAEKALLSCVASFLDPSTPLTSAAVVSPTDCVRVFLATRDAAAGTADAGAAEPTTLFSLDALTPVVDTVAVPGMARFESVLPLPSNENTAGEALQWSLVQEAGVAFTAQTSVYTPSASAASDAGACAGTAAPAGDTLGVVGDWGNMCGAGTYVLEGTATCAACPSACAAPEELGNASTSAAAAAPLPVYCPGDGVMHGCPRRPPDAVFAGSPSSAQTSPSSACRYTCANAFMAPLDFSCTSVVGMFYNTSATGNTDGSNGGGLSRCEGPAALFAPAAPVRSLTRLYALVGSGAADAPRTCAFTLLHRATSSLVTLAALQRVGLAPPSLSVCNAAGANATESSSLPSSSSPSSAPLLLEAHTGVTWDVEVRLNATQLRVMHTTALHNSQSITAHEDDEAPGTTTTTIAHDLMTLLSAPAWGAHSSPGDAERVVSWYLVSTMNHTEGTKAAAPSTTFSLRLLLNTSMWASSSAAAAGNTTTIPAPSSLIVRSPAWTWAPWRDRADPPLLASTYRAVLNRATNTIAFFLNGTIALGVPVHVAHSMWASTPADSTHKGRGCTGADTLSSRTPFFLAAGGWVAGYAPLQQWTLVTTTPTAHLETVLLPLQYDYVPGAVTRISTTASILDGLATTLGAAEREWRVEAAAAAAAEGQRVAGLTSLADLASVIAATPLVAANVSAALCRIALRSTRGLDGVCRPGYGMASPIDTACEACVPGSYTVMGASSWRSRCACLPQRVGAVCGRRAAGPVPPQSLLKSADTLYLDGDVVGGGSGAGLSTANIPLGSYAAGASTSMLGASVTCLYALTVPTVTSVTAAGSTSGNTTVAVQYTTGLGGESCVARAAAYSDVAESPAFSSSPAADDALRSAPTYTTPSMYALRLQAPALTRDFITLQNNSALFTDQTVLTVGVRGYALLTDYAVHSLLQMEQLTEYELAFLAYVLRSTTVTAELDCGEPTVRSFTWSAGSALNTFVLWANLSDAVTTTCVVSVSVTSANAAASESPMPPFPSWPYAYLRVPPSVSPSSFFSSLPPLQLTLRPASRSFATSAAHTALCEVSTLIIAICVLVLSVMLALMHGTSHHAPSLDPLPWRQYERVVVKTLSYDEDC